MYGLLLRIDENMSMQFEFGAATVTAASTRLQVAHPQKNALKFSLKSCLSLFMLQNTKKKENIRVVPIYSRSSKDFITPQRSLFTNIHPPFVDPPDAAEIKALYSGGCELGGG